MQSKYDITEKNEQDPQKVSQELAEILESYLSPLLLVLDTLLDKRLVRTFVQCMVAIIRFRNSKQGLILSELGSYMDSYSGLSVTATAGTKRISNLLRSIKWSVLQIDRYLLEEADKEVKKLKEQGKKILCIWDGSVLEKPERRPSRLLCNEISRKMPTELLRQAETIPFHHSVPNKEGALLVSGKKKPITPNAGYR